MDLLAFYGEPIPVRGIEGGTIALLDFMGDDQAIVQAARTSYGNAASLHKWDWGFESDHISTVCTVCEVKGDFQLATKRPDQDPPEPSGHCISGDRNLIRHLVSNRHTTPIEACEIKLHVKLPIFVERQWARHRTASFNEMSGRYMALDQGYYVPSAERLQHGAQATGNKQGSEESDWSDERIGQERKDIRLETEFAHGNYTDRIDEGMAKELARVNMPVSAFTVKVWKMDLHNLVHFLSLRLDPHAQWEIRMYAEVIAQIVRDWCPLLWEAVYDYRLEAVHLSRMEAAVLREYVRMFTDGQNNRPWLKKQMEAEGLTKRERGAFLRKLGLLDG